MDEELVKELAKTLCRYALEGAAVDFVAKGAATPIQAAGAALQASEREENWSRFVGPARACVIKIEELAHIIPKPKL